MENADVDWHPTEDDLVLHYYQEAPSDVREAVEGHLTACSGCAARWQVILETLALAGTDDVADPGPDFTERLGTAIRPRLTRPAGRPTWRPAVVLGTLAASLLLATASGAIWIRLNSPADHPAVAEGNSAGSTDTSVSDRRERVLLSALTDHFSRTEMLLVELLNAPDVAPVPLAFEQSSADDLVASGRLYRATAEETGDVQFAGVLDDLESVLVEVARSGRMQPEDMTSLRARIRDDALLFKVRAVATEIRDRQQTWRP